MNVDHFRQLRGLFLKSGQNLWPKIWDSAFWARFSLFGLRGNSHWKTRNACLRSLQLLSCPSLTLADQRDLKRNLFTLVDDAPSALIWLKVSKVISSAQTADRNMLQKILRGIEVLNEADKQGEIERVLPKIDDYLRSPELMLKADLKTRSFIVCLFKFGQAYQLLEDRNSLLCDHPSLQNVKKWTDDFGNFDALMRKLRASTLWNNRMILFHSRKGQLALTASKDPLKALAALLLPDQLHTALLTKAQTEDVSAWQITFHHHSRQKVRDSEIGTSEILQLETAKLLMPDQLESLQKALGALDHQSLVKTLDEMLERAIEDENSRASHLHLHNSRWARTRIPLNSLMRSRFGMPRGSEFREHQRLNCCHYVASILFRAVERVNGELAQLMPNSSRVLRHAINPRLHPSGILPGALYGQLLKVSSRVQSNR